MSQLAKRKLSGSTDGRQIKVVATATPGTLIHTSVTGVVPGTWDEIWLWGCNSSAAVVGVQVQLGGTTNPDDLIGVNIPPTAGLMLLLPGLILQNGTIVRVFAGTANVIMVSGYVNAIGA